MGHNSREKPDQTRLRAGRHPSALRPQLPYRIEEIAKAERKTLLNPQTGPPWKYAPVRGRPVLGLLVLILGEDTKLPSRGRVCASGLAFDEADARTRLHAYNRRVLLRAGGEARRRRARDASLSRRSPVT